MSRLPAAILCLFITLTSPILQGACMAERLVETFDEMGRPGAIEPCPCDVAELSPLLSSHKAPAGIPRLGEIEPFALELSFKPDSFGISRDFVPRPVIERRIRLVWLESYRC